MQMWGRRRGASVVAISHISFDLLILSLSQSCSQTGVTEIHNIAFGFLKLSDTLDKRNMWKQNPRETDTHMYIKGC